MRYRTIAAVSGVAAGLALLLVQTTRDAGPSLSATGQLVAFEASQHELTLRTPLGDRHFIVRDATPVHDGATTVEAAELSTASGCTAKVWYRVGKERPIAREVRISCSAGSHRGTKVSHAVAAGGRSAPGDPMARPEAR